MPVNVVVVVVVVVDIASSSTGRNPYRLTWSISHVSFYNTCPSLTEQTQVLVISVLFWITDLDTRLTNHASLRSGTHVNRVYLTQIHQSSVNYSRHAPILVLLTSDCPGPPQKVPGTGAILAFGEKTRMAPCFGDGVRRRWVSVGYRASLHRLTFGCCSSQTKSHTADFIWDVFRISKRR